MLDFIGVGAGITEDGGEPLRLVAHCVFFSLQLAGQSVYWASPVGHQMNMLAEHGKPHKDHRPAGGFAGWCHFELGEAQLQFFSSSSACDLLLFLISLGFPLTPPPRCDHVTLKASALAAVGAIQAGMAQSSSKRVIYAALGGNLLVAMTKFVAAGLTGSAAMFSEAIHSTVDSGNQLLLLLGMRRAARPANSRHPFGHGLQPAPVTARSRETHPPSGPSS